MAKGSGKSWLVPLIAGVALGWLFSATIGRTIGPIVGKVGVHPFGYDE